MINETRKAAWKSGRVGKIKQLHNVSEITLCNCYTISSCVYSSASVFYACGLTSYVSSSFSRLA